MSSDFSSLPISPEQSAWLFCPLPLSAKTPERVPHPSEPPNALNAFFLPYLQPPIPQPPLAITMSNKEEDIQNALTDLSTKRFRSIRQSAAFHNVKKSTLAHRARGRPARTTIDPNSQRLSSTQEQVLVQWIQDLQRVYMTPNYIKIRFVVTQILRKNGDSRPLGKHWITNFRKRHPQLRSGYSRSMEMKRLVALSPDMVELHFNEIAQLKLQYQVDSSRIHNMDEKGFQMGQHSGDYTVFDALLGPPLAPSTGITQWVTIIECITADGTSLKPYVIFMGQEPETGWWPATECLQDWVWAFSPKGWTDNELGVDWLKKVLIPHTTQSDQHHILILDGHDSHETDQFQWHCLQHRIHLVWLPPHTSHKLQPLDVGPFSSLASHYGQAVHKYTPTGYATINRATFTMLYTEVRLSAMTERNIRAGWKRAGIDPWDVDRILQDPDVINCGRTTPQVVPPPSTTIQEGYPITPKKLEDYERLVAQIEAKASPGTRVAIRKLQRAAVQEYTANQVLTNEVKEVRQHAVDKEMKKRSARLEKQAQQRSWTLQQLIEARSRLRRVRIISQRKRRPKKLVLAIPIKRPNQESE